MKKETKLFEKMNCRNYLLYLVWFCCWQIQKDKMKMIQGIIIPLVTKKKMKLDWISIISIINIWFRNKKKQAESKKKVLIFAFFALVLTKKWFKSCGSFVIWFRKKEIRSKVVPWVEGWIVVTTPVECFCY